MTPMVEAYLQGSRVKTSPSLCAKGGEEKLVYRKDKYYFDSHAKCERFSLVPSRVYVTSPLWYLTGPNLLYILGILNSRMNISILDRQGVSWNRAYKPKDMQKVLLPPDPTPQEIRDISTVVSYILYLEPYEEEYRERLRTNVRDRSYNYDGRAYGYFRALLELLIVCLYYPKEKGIVLESLYRNDYYDFNYILTPNLKLPSLEDIEGCYFTSLLAIYYQLDKSANIGTITDVRARVERRIPI